MLKGYMYICKLIFKRPEKGYSKLWFAERVFLFSCFCVIQQVEEATARTPCLLSASFTSSLHRSFSLHSVAFAKRSNETSAATATSTATATAKLAQETLGCFNYGYYLIFSPPANVVAITTPHSSAQLSSDSRLCSAPRFSSPSTILHLRFSARRACICVCASARVCVCQCCLARC